MVMRANYHYGYAGEMNQGQFIAMACIIPVGTALVVWWLEGRKPPPSN
jgi:hypothetical protein